MKQGLDLAPILKCQPFWTFTMKLWDHRSNKFRLKRKKTGRTKIFSLKLLRTKLWAKHRPGKFLNSTRTMQTRSRARAQCPKSPPKKINCCFKIILIRILRRVIILSSGGIRYNFRPQLNQLYRKAISKNKAKSQTNLYRSMITSFKQSLTRRINFFQKLSQQP